ncbi:hypothetical protein AGOR_G00065850 [Albula goreensis]|uniref:PHD-type domain-containing protein n=1 Tax=Albula goreensis TaxID=1534307 RepID=A0A8T3DZV3_9TELE|nr:hypothetical protein AGOR_G00065850 [Albula goreensis]
MNRDQTDRIRKIECGFCKSSLESRTTGPLRKKDDLVAHHNCLFYSSNLVNRNTPDEDEFMGFLVEDVKDEIKRGSKLKCARCKKNGATVGCEVKKCKRSYHYRCAMKDGARNVEDCEEGVFKIYCYAHKQLEDNFNGQNSSAASFKRTYNEDTSDDEVLGSLSKRRRLSTSKVRRALNDEFSSASDEGRNDIPDSELGPLEFDSEDSESMTQIPLNLTEPENGRPLTDEPQPSTSGAFQTKPEETRKKVEKMAAQEMPRSTQELSKEEKSEMAAVTLKATETHVQPCDKGGDETDIELEQDSPSLLMPFQITHVESIAPSHSGNTSRSASPKPACLASHFWRKCREAGCVESIFTRFISVMKTISEKILSEQASEEECALSLRVIEASGVLPDLFAQKDREFEEKLLSLQKESESVMRARELMKNAGEMKIPL